MLIATFVAVIIQVTSRPRVDLLFIFAHPRTACRGLLIKMLVRKHPISPTVFPRNSRSWNSLNETGIEHPFSYSSQIMNDTFQVAPGGHSLLDEKQLPGKHRSRCREGWSISQKKTITPGTPYSRFTKLEAPVKRSRSRAP